VITVPEYIKEEKIKHRHRERETHTHTGLRGVTFSSCIYLVLSEVVSYYTFKKLLL